MLIYTPPSTAKVIPVIDLSGSFSDRLGDRKAVAWEVHKACRDTGFFYISNHQVPQDLVDRQLACAREFFALPLDQKLAIDVAKSATMRGYEPMASQTLDDGSRPDMKEGFMAGVDGAQSYVSNGDYNSVNQWPESLPSMKAQTVEYIAAMTKLGKHLLSVLALSLELPEDYFAEGLNSPMVTTRLLHYPPQTGVGNGNQIGAGAHTDWGMLTMLFQDDVGGLEVRNADGEWVRAPHIPGTFVINLGDMVPVLTNGLYQSNMHRVLNLSPDRHRHSVPTFFDPNFHYRIKPIESDTAGVATKFNETTVGQHIADMYARTYGDQKAAA